MQNNNDDNSSSSNSNNRQNNNGSPSSSRKQDRDKDDSTSAGGETSSRARNGFLIVPTNTHDGGGMDLRLTGNGEGELQSTNVNGGGSRSETTTTRTSSSPPDSFETYSDIDIRMTTLLGLEPPSNPNDGEEQEDWRQLTGFQGLGRHRRRQPGNNNNNNDDDHGAEEVDAPGVPVNGNRETSTPRRTRLTWELHTSCFENMWMQRGELNGPVHEPEPPRARVEPRPRQDQQRRSGGEN